MKTHILKTWPEFFAALADGSKTFELRRNDRDFKPGDVLELREFDPTGGDFTGRMIRRRVGYMLTHDDCWEAFAFYGLCDGGDDWCIMSLHPVESP